MERALTLAGSDQDISEKYLSSKIFDPMDHASSESERNGTLQEVTERIEKQMVQQALEAAGGNRSQASKQLGITRQGLLNKIKRYDIEK
jgi:transcriptional regulator with PAS, ATPase and Fis domain